MPVNTGDFHFSKAIVLVLYWVKADNNRWDFSFSQYQALEPKEENRMEITIYRRHSASCPQKAYRYAPRCGCPLSGQFNWTRSATNLDGKKLKHEQNKWSLNARLWSEAQQNALSGRSPSPSTPQFRNGWPSGQRTDSPTRSRSSWGQARGMVQKERRATPQCHHD